jgi:hypothetical protein
VPENKPGVQQGGLTLARISAYFAEIYRTSVSARDCLADSGKVIEEIQTWQQQLHFSTPPELAFIKVIHG